MLPIRDTIRSYNFPFVNWLLIGGNALVFLFETSLSPAMLDRLIGTFGLVPARLHLDNPALLASNPFVLVTLFTHMFLHGGWFHLLSNMWMLFIFGDNVEDRLGSGRYLVFYLMSGVAAGLVQAFVGPGSAIPSVGASGAIAGVLGAYFLLYPNSRVITLIPLVFIPWFVEIPSLFYLGIWFVSQLYSGLASLGLPNAASLGGVAWFAHIGGFVFGLLTIKLFLPRRHPAYQRRYPDEYYPW
ncbi:MAG: rhomboid family intramembrane serine protease [Anaerolineales bacterium]|nr:rhomboid family intramembrane serine protease [Anaerolineales bacterium]